VYGRRSRPPAKDRTERVPDARRFRFGERHRNRDADAHQLDPNADAGTERNCDTHCVADPEPHGDADAVSHTHRSSIGNVRAQPDVGYDRGRRDRLLDGGDVYGGRGGLLGNVQRR
jgi:hypothetical protein